MMALPRGLPFMPGRRTAPPQLLLRRWCQPLGIKVAVARRMKLGGVVGAQGASDRPGEIRRRAIARRFRIDSFGGGRGGSSPACTRRRVWAAAARWSRPERSRSARLSWNARRYCASVQPRTRRRCDPPKPRNHQPHRSHCTFRSATSRGPGSNALAGARRRPIGGGDERGLRPFGFPDGR